MVPQSRVRQPVRHGCRCPYRHAHLRLRHRRADADRRDERGRNPGNLRVPAYGYDQADRLTSWTATPTGGSATTHAYGYDADGNLVNDNGVTQTFDARDELTSDSNGNSYTYTAAGDLATQVTAGGTTLTSTTVPPAARELTGRSCRRSRSGSARTAALCFRRSSRCLGSLGCRRTR